MVCPESSTSWRPVLSGEAAEACGETVRAISESLLVRLWGEEESDSRPPPLPTSASVDADVAVLFAYLADRNQRASEWAVRLADRAAETVAESVATVGLFGGLAGVAWAIEHVFNRVAPGDIHDPNSETDEFFLGHVERSAPTSEFDLVGGHIAIGVYALERGPRPIAAEILRRIELRLTRLALHRIGGVTELQARSKLRDRSHANFLDGLGMAHGVAGAVAFLCRLHEAKMLSGPGEDALGQLAHDLHTAKRRALDEARHNGRALARGPTGWCWGDIAIAVALLRGAQCCGIAAWAETAVELAAFHASQPVSTVAADDASLCHGAAGVAHIYSRMYQATNDERFRRAATAWFGRSLEMRRTGLGIGGYDFWADGPNGTLVRAPTAAFLTGAAGVALALVAGCSTLDPLWDRVLLLSFPKEGDVV